MEIETYTELSKIFNKLYFKDKIKFLIQNKDKLTLAADGNWWGVKVTNSDIQEMLEEKEITFSIENEWQASQMFDLIDLLDLKITDI